MYIIKLFVFLYSVLFRRLELQLPFQHWRDCNDLLLSCLQLLTGIVADRLASIDTDLQHENPDQFIKYAHVSIFILRILPLKYVSAFLFCREIKTKVVPVQNQLLALRIPENVSSLI